MQTISANTQTRIIAIVLAAISLLSILAMLHHPSVSSHDLQEQIAEIRSESGINSFVHGILIIFMIVISGCLTFYVQLKGAKKASLLFGILSYWLGVFAMIVAALMSGFVSPDLAERYFESSTAQLEVYSGLKHLAWTINQNFANFGALCWCSAICFWAFDMMAKSMAVRLFGIISFIGALVIAISLLSDWLSLSVHGMTLVLIFVSAWQLGISWLMFKNE